MKRHVHHFLSKTPLLVRVVSLNAIILISIGCFYFLLPSVHATQSADLVSTPPSISQQATTSVDVASPPRLISLPRIGLMREVVDGAYDATSGNWTLNEDKVQFATMTSRLRTDAGQTIIYGHNTAAVLEPVKSVELGDELIVTSEAGQQFIYTFTHDRIVDPADVSVLDEQSLAPRVVLMTCEGWLSDTRRLLYFDFKEVRL